MATFAEDQLERLETLLAANVGVSSVSVDGVSVSYDDLLKQYDYWRNRVAREEGTRPRIAQINLGSP
jgi:hypothetical protein